MKYICEFYIPVENDEGRYFTLSSCDKASYIHNVMNRLGLDVEIISSSYAKKYSRQRTDFINEHVKVISGFSLGWNGPISKIMSRISSMMWLLFYLLTKCERGETIMIYHGVQNIPIYLFAKMIKNFNYILEVEEIYSAIALSKGAGWRFKLEKAMFNRADKFLFASKQLEQFCNAKKRPFVVVTGSYLVPELLSDKFNDGKIHIVYAGAIDKREVANKSAKIAQYLDDRYVIHILGYGADEDIDILKKEIDQINTTSTCRVIYEGLKRGDEYISFLQSCHIGLCPLSNDKTFQMACFPSKITSYLANGLLVATTENEVLKESCYKNLLFFAEDDSPLAFAETIKKMVNCKDINPREVVMNEDMRFEMDLSQLLK